MSSVPRLVITVLTTLILAIGLAVFAEQVARPWSVPFMGAFVVGLVLISLTDRRRFGWIE